MSYVNIVVSEDVHRRLKVAAAQKGVKIKDLAEEALRMWLDGLDELGVVGPDGKRYRVVEVHD